MPSTRVLLQVRWGTVHPGPPPPPLGRFAVDPQMSAGSLKGQREAVGVGGSAVSWWVRPELDLWHAAVEWLTDVWGARALPLVQPRELSRSSPAYCCREERRALTKGWVLSFSPANSRYFPVSLTTSCKDNMNVLSQQPLTYWTLSEVFTSLGHVSCCG